MIGSSSHHLWLGSSLFWEATLFSDTTAERIGVVLYLFPDASATNVKYDSSMTANHLPFSPHICHRLRVEGCT